MKRIAVLLLIVLLITGTTGCFGGKTANQKESVKINMPKDNTVNGYRLNSSKEESNNSSTVTADKVTVDSETQSDKNNTDSIKTMYCANIKSKVFHKSDCSLVINMKDENKFYLSYRNELINDGYIPCKKCNP